MKGYRTVSPYSVYPECNYGELVSHVLARHTASLPRCVLVTHSRLQHVYTFAAVAAVAACQANHCVNTLACRCQTANNLARMVGFGVRAGTRRQGS